VTFLQEIKISIPSPAISPEAHPPLAERTAGLSKGIKFFIKHP
jgi:hypothetical protein